MSIERAHPPRLHAERLHDLVALYLAESLERGDLGALGPLRLLRDRVEALLAEHARAAHEGDGQPWREVGEALNVTASAVTAWARAGQQRPVPRRANWRSLDAGMRDYGRGAASDVGC